MTGFMSFAGSLKVPFLFLTNGELSCGLSSAFMEESSGFALFNRFLYALFRLLLWLYAGNMFKLWKIEYQCGFIWIGGGIPESRRALELSELLGVKILPSQVCFQIS